MFRLPKALIAFQDVQDYGVEDVIAFRSTHEHVILDVRFQEEGVVYQVEGEWRLSLLVALREDLLRHDYRMLHLAWLKAAGIGAVDRSETEPPVPPGLRSLSSPLRKFAELFEIDPHLISAAANGSSELVTRSADELRQAIAKLSQDERDDFLLRLARGEPHLSIALPARLQQLAGMQSVTSTTRRTVSQLLADAERARERERRAQAREAEQKHRVAMEALAAREDEAWQEVHRRLQNYSAKGYEEAVQLTAQLRELAVYQGQATAFQARLNTMYERYRNRSSLLQKLRAAGLHPA